MDFSEILINTAYMVILTSLAVRDILFLRIIVVIGSSLFISYALIFDILAMMWWNLVFISINIYQIIRIIIERRPIKLSSELNVIYQTCFTNMSTRDFLSFWHFGQENIYENEKVCEEGLTPERLLYIISGEAEVYHKKNLVINLEARSFVAEMSFLTHKPASADVYMSGRALTWNREKLEVLEKVNPRLIAELRVSIGEDLSKKLGRAPMLCDTDSGKQRVNKIRH